MTSHRPRRTEQIRDPSGLLDAMGRCRRTVLDAQDGVRAFGVVFHGCGMVISAIDALAHLITGQPHYYSIAGSTAAGAPPGRGGSCPEAPTRSGSPTGPEPARAPVPEPGGD